MPKEATDRKRGIMAAKDDIEIAFKELVVEKAYKKVTISDICERSGVSRKTFYANFRDKEAVVEDLFYRHVVKPSRDLNELLSFDVLAQMETTCSEKMYENIYKDRDYYYALVKPLRGTDDTFIRVATWVIYHFNIDHLPNVAAIEPEWKLDYVSYFFASSQAMFMQKWISDGMKITPQELAECYCDMTMSYWHRKFAEKKEA